MIITALVILFILIVSLIIIFIKWHRMERKAKILSQLIDNTWEQYRKETEHLVPFLKMPKPGEPYFKQTKEEKE